MFSKNIDYYKREVGKEKQVEFDGFDVKKLKKALPKKRGEDVWITLWNRTNKYKEKEKEFWNLFGDRYSAYAYGTIKLQYFPSEIDSESFEDFLDLINGEDTEFLLDLGFPSVKITKSAIKNNVAVINYHNCKACKNSKWQGVLGALSRATMVKVLFLGDVSESQMIDILRLRSEIDNLRIFPGNKKFLKNEEVFKRLNELKDTIQFPSEIQIGGWDFKSTKQKKKWVNYCGSDRLEKILRELNDRQNKETFWKRVIEDAIKKNKMSKFARSKLMFIGKGRAGKTSTIRSLLDKQFRQDENSTPVADAKGQIRIITQDVSVSTWKPKEEGELVHKTDFVDVIAQAKNDKSHGFVNRGLWFRDESRRMNRERGLMGNGRTRNRNGLAPRTGARPLTVVGTQETRLVIRNQGQDLKISLSETMVKQIMIKKSDTDENSTLNQTSRRPQNGAKKSKKKEKKQKVTRTITIWDFGGQEVFYTVHHLFLTDNGVYVLVFDFSKMMTDKAGELANLRFWLDSVTLYASKAPLFIVATHVIKYSQKDFIKIDEEVITPLLQEYGSLLNHKANELENLNFYLIENSDKNKKIKRTQVDKLRDNIEKSIKETSDLFEKYSRAVPLSWIYFMNHLIKDGQTKLIYSDILKEAKEVNISVENVERILELYHEFGTILSFRGEANSDAEGEDKKVENTLKDHIILSPQWLVDALKTFIYTPGLHHKERLKHNFYKKERKNIEDYEKSGILLNSTFEKLLVKHDEKSASSSAASKYIKYSEKDFEFLLSFFQKMYLISPFSFKQVQSLEKKSSWFIPSMCKNDEPPNGMDKFFKKKIIEVQILTKRRQPKGFYERIVCLFLKESNSREGVREPYISNKHSVIFLHGIRLYLTKAREEDLSGKKEEKEKGDLNEEDEDKCIKLRLQYSSKKHFKIQTVLKTAEKIIKSLDNDTLGQVLKPKLLALAQLKPKKERRKSAESKLSKGDTNKRSRCLLTDLRVACEQDEDVPIYQEYVDESVEFFEPFNLIFGAKPAKRKNTELLNVSKEEIAFDCFIAHEWGTWEDNFPTHQRAKELRDALKKKGLKVWLDEDNLGDNVALGISKGLEQSAVIIVLLTKRYFSRCEDRDTNAHKEFIMATTFGQKWLLPLVMDGELLDPSKWINGVVKFHLGAILWTAYTNKKQQKENLAGIVAKVQALAKEKKAAKAKKN